MPSRSIDSLGEFRRIISGNSLVIVFFHASWSLPSKQIKPIYEQISDLAEYNRWLYFCWVDCDNQPDIVSLNGGPFPIPNIPTFAIFRNGRELDRVVGNNGATGIRDFIRKFAPPPHSPPPPSQFYIPSGHYYPSN